MNIISYEFILYIFIIVCTLYIIHQIIKTTYNKIENLKQLKRTNSDYKLNKYYRSRKITSTEEPQFKLNAYCINLKDKIKNMEFIHSEWDEYLNIKRFNALSSGTKSHVAILKNIYENKETHQFPIVVMEDDVYKKNNFTKYWNQLLNLTNCDYVTLDAFYLVFKSNQDLVPLDFVSLKESRATGFIIYYKRFFDRFNNINELDCVINKTPIDLNFTHNPLFIKYTPVEQICCQIVNKKSTTANVVTTKYLKYYKKAEKKLLKYRTTYKLNNYNKLFLI